MSDKGNPKREKESEDVSPEVPQEEDQLETSGKRDYHSENSSQHLEEEKTSLKVVEKEELVTFKYHQDLNQQICQVEEPLDYMRFWYLQGTEIESSRWTQNDYRKSYQHQEFLEDAKDQKPLEMVPVMFAGGEELISARRPQNQQPYRQNYDPAQQQPPPGYYNPNRPPPPRGYSNGGYQNQQGYYQEGYYQQPPPSRQRPQDNRYPPPPNAPPPYYAHNQPEVVVVVMPNRFNSVKVRNRFVRKVYFILSLMLAFSFGFVILSAFEPATREGFKRNWLPIFIVCMVVMMVSSMVLTCVEAARRTVPYNFILLTILVLATTGLMMLLTSACSTMAAVYAMATTLLVTTLISLFAIQTKWDVTGCGMCLCIAALVLMIFGMIVMILFLCGIYLKWLHITLAALVALLACMFLMYDTQLIVGGRKHQLDPEEYILGAVCLYIDITTIYMQVLGIFGLTGN